MENASKALIIAGAILISILLISVGIIVMNAINDPVSQAGDSSASQAIEIFNSKFTAYTGEISGSTLRSAISTINASNGTDSTHKVALTSSVSGLTSASIKSNETYTVDAKYADKDTGLSYTASASVISGPTTPASKNGYLYELNISAKK